MHKNTTQDVHDEFLEVPLFINKSTTGRNNICGENVALLRKQMHLSQRELADRLQLVGLDVDKNAIQRIESGQRFVTDIELVAMSKIFGITLDRLIHYDNDRNMKTTI